MLDRLTLKNFTVFRDAEFAFTPGLNVLIGANGTGKTHAMKAAYFLLRAAKNFLIENHFQDDTSDPGYAAYLQRVLGSFFLGREVGSLIRKPTNSTPTSLSITLDEFSVSSHFSRIEALTWTTEGEHPDTVPSSLFMPAREVLSIYRRLVAAYTHRELDFDATYHDICHALDDQPLQGDLANEASALSELLEEILGAKVILKHEHFYISSDIGEIESNLVAEGHRRIATLIHLINNGSIAKGSILFWDEPETNLNPKLIKVIAEALIRLAANGVQIIIASHDYLLTNEISLQAEYQTEAAKAAQIRFFCLSRDENRDIAIESGNTLADLTHNPIMEEFAALYDRERLLFLSKNDQIPSTEK